MRANIAQGIPHFFITDDTLARDRRRAGAFDRLIALRETERPKPVERPRTRAGPAPGSGG